ncbi:MAG: glycoside hydrolase family 3 protein [Bdellovibrionales bacterium]|nr:glycoside hydrolase family 3 protein [Bdellovibrionales bacterium]
MFTFCCIRPAHGEVPLDQMSVQQKVGQLFVFGFKGDKLTPELKKSITSLKPGGFIVFGRNIKSLSQIAKLNADLQLTSLSQNNPALFLAVDQEGGAVTRIKTSPPLPSAYTIGGTNEPTLAYQAGKVTGEMLGVLGFNMNLAPVLDMTDDKLDSFISARSFSASPSQISSMGLAFAQGLAESKILPVAKHFPGHGPIALDTHQVTPSRSMSLGSLMNSELIPFTDFAASSMPSGVMVAHIVFPDIDPSNSPATYSKKLVNDILLDQLKFKGLVMTDDIEMQGAAALQRIEDRAVAAFLTGNDLIMVGWTPSMQKRAVQGVLAAVKSGKISRARLDHSVKKILAVKEKLVPPPVRKVAQAKLETNTTLLSKTIANRFKKIQYSSVFNSIIARYFKSLSDAKSVAETVDHIVVISPVSSFHSSFNKVEKTQKVVNKSELTATTPLSSQTLLVYHVTSPQTFEGLRKIPGEMQKKTIVVSSHPKLRVQDTSSFLGVVETYSHSPMLGKFTAEAINKILIANRNAEFRRE